MITYTVTMIVKFGPSGLIHRLRKFTIIKLVFKLIRSSGKRLKTVFKINKEL